MISSISDLLLSNSDTGIGLALRDTSERFVFGLAGTRHRCKDGELFFSGVGGHLEQGESWVECAHREAYEELGLRIRLKEAKMTWHIPQGEQPYSLSVSDKPRPLALYDMIHPPHSPKEGELYQLVIYEAFLLGSPIQFPADELSGVIALTKEQTIQCAIQRMCLGDLESGGGQLLVSNGDLSPGTELFPIGTALALSRILAIASHSL